MDPAPATVAIQASMAHLLAMSPPKVIEVLWHLFKQSILSGSQYDMEIPSILAKRIGQEGVEVLVARFSYIIGAPVSAVEDVTRNVLQIMPSRNLLGHNSVSSGAQKPKAKTPRSIMPTKVARPLNNFILYRKHHHPLIKARNLDLHNNEISRILGAQWKNESETTKAHFSHLAKQLKAQHLLENPGYQYQPRKSSEKKRRMTRRKAAAIASSSQVSNEASVPEVPKSVSGNAMINLGDEDLDEETLAAMLTEWNNTRPRESPQAGAMIAALPAAIYNEPTEEAQNDKNFYLSQTSFQPDALLADEVAAEMEAKLAGAEDFEAMMALLSPNAQKTNFEEHFGSSFDAELLRMADWNDESFLL